MKKKKIILTGLLGISVLAASVSLASCNAIPLTPYQSSTSEVTPTPSSSQPQPSESSIAPAASSSDVAPAQSSSVTPEASSSLPDAPTSYSVTYEVGGHGTAPENKIEVTALTAEDLPELTAEGYAFAGWYTDNAFTTAAVAGDISADVTLYAKWVSFKTFADITALEEAGDVRASVVDPDEYTLGANDNGLRQDKIREWETTPQVEGSKSNRDYIEGLYQSRNATASATTVPSKENNYVYAEDGKIKMFDNGNADKGASLIIFDSRATTGIHEAVFDVSINAAASNLTFLQVMGKDTARAEAVNEIFGLRTVKNDDDKKIYVKYRVDGGDPIEPETLVEQTANTVLHVYLKADVDNKTITVVINGKLIADAVEIPGLEFIDYTRFVSSNSGSTLVELSNIAFYQSMTKEQAIVYATDRLEKIISAKDATLYDADGLAELQSIKETAVAAFSAAAVEDDQDVFELLFTCIPYIANVQTAADKAVLTAKVQAATEVGAYLEAASLDMFKAVGFEYEENGVTITLDINSIEGMFESDLDACTTVEEITDATNGLIKRYKDNIDSLSDSSSMMLAYYKDVAKAGIDELYPSGNYTTNATDYANAYDAFTAALTAATNKAGVDTAVTDANTALGAIAKDSYNLLKSNELKAYAADAVKSLLLYTRGQYTGSQSETNINAEVTSQVTAIYAIDEANIDDIDAQLITSKAAIDSVISTEKSATEVTVSFDSTVLEIDSIVVLVGDKISEPVLSATELAKLTEDNTATTGIKTVYNVKYYSNDGLTDLWDFDNTSITSSNNVVYVGLDVASRTWTYTPVAQSSQDSAAVVQESSIFTATTKAGTSIAKGDFPFDGNVSKIEFNLSGVGLVTVSMKMKASSGGMTITDETDSENVKTVKTFTPVTENLTYSFARKDATEALYKIARTSSTQHLYSLTVTIEYGTPVTLTQKVSDNTDEDVLLATTVGKTITLTDYEKAGYVFEGWYEKYENNTYSDLIDTTTMVLSSDKTIYGKVTPITYNVVFDLDGGNYDGDSVNPTQNNIAYNGTITALDDSKVQKDNYMFLGWYTKNENGEFSDTAYNFASKLTAVPTSGSVVNVTIYAKWICLDDLTKSTITYKLNGGKYEDSSDDLVIGGPTGSLYLGYGVVAEPDETKLTHDNTNKAFDGWYTKDGSSTSDWGDKFVFGEIIEVETLTLYAKWVNANEKEVTFKDGDNVVLVSKGGVGETLTFPSTDKAGYQFIRYYQDSTFTKEFTENTIPSESTTVYLCYMELDKAGVTYVNTADDLITAIGNNATIYLTADIDMSLASTPYEGKTSNYYGSFNGFGYKISKWNVAALQQQYSFFGQVYGGTIENVIFDSCSVTATTNYASILTSGAYGDEIISNITFKKCELLSTGQYAGLIAGSGNLGTYGSVTDNDLNVNNITIIDSKVTGSKYSGGLFGNANKGNIVVNGLFGSIEFNAAGTDTTSSGGIIGWVKDRDFSLTNANITIEVVGLETGSYKSQNLGGLVGGIQKDKTNTNFSVTNSKINVTMETVNKVAGAIAGTVNNAGCTLTVENCDIVFNLSGVGESIAGISGRCVGALVLDTVKLSGTIRADYRTSAIVGYFNASGASLTATNVELGDLTIGATKNSSSAANTVYGQSDITTAPDLSGISYAASKVSVSYNVASTATAVTSLQGTNTEA